MKFKIFRKIYVSGIIREIFNQLNPNFGEKKSNIQGH